MREGGRRAEAEFDAYVHARVGALSRTAFLLTGDHQLAEDLVQTTLFKAAKAWHRIEGDPDPYVRRVLANENISGWRKRRHVRELPLEAYGAEPAAPSTSCRWRPTCSTGPPATPLPRTGRPTGDRSH